MPRWKETAPAKVNLALDILRRRPDGYHDLHMVMQSVSLCDTVTVEEQPDGFTLDTGGGFAPRSPRSMEQRAAEAFFSAIGQPMPGLRVTLEKRIPAYAGLGGGSSDVAALLRVLRAAYCPSLCTEAVERIGLSIGSDVPFCVRGGAALAEGRGEVLTPLPPLPDAHFVLCKPAFGISTPALFDLADRTQRTRRPDVAGMAEAVRRADCDAVAARMANVFEDALPPEYAEVFTVKRRLLELGARNAVMSGSGPTVCGLFPNAAAARAAADTLRNAYPETFYAVATPPAE
ncbi:MAG: 4-(cytidine 5'-diphospho)-2-C-methyl-D-erythritol kinase [Oscillibacter sp.]|nr:4-(cytidine 5'-diphospho)-2-C-methyl-D-erythritol kinase [Oscillibacter sp.]